MLGGMGVVMMMMRWRGLGSGGVVGIVGYGTAGSGDIVGSGIVGTGFVARGIAGSDIEADHRRLPCRRLRTWTGSETETGSEIAIAIVTEP